MPRVIKLGDLIAAVPAVLYNLIFFNIYLGLKRVYVFLFADPIRTLDLSGKTLLITGSSNGIGRQLVVDIFSMPKEHHPRRLLLWDMEEADHELLSTAPGWIEVFTEQVDISDYERVTKLLCTLVNRKVNIDICIFNAGFAVRKLFLEQSFKEFSSVMNVNLIAYMHMTQEVIRLFKPKQLLYTASVFSYNGYAYFAEYCASKAALRAFAEGLKQELYMTGGVPDILLIHPSPVQTRLIENMENENPALSLMLVQPSDVSFSMLKLLKYPELNSIIVGMFFNIIYLIKPFINQPAFDSALNQLQFLSMGERSTTSKDD